MTIIRISTTGWFARRKYEAYMHLNGLYHLELTLIIICRLLCYPHCIFHSGYHRCWIAPPRFCRGHNQDYHFYRLPMGRWPCPSFNQNMLELRWKLGNSHSNSWRSCTSQNSAQPPLSPRVARFPVDSIYSPCRDSPLHNSVKLPDWVPKSGVWWFHVRSWQCYPRKSWQSLAVLCGRTGFPLIRLKSHELYSLPIQDAFALLEQKFAYMHAIRPYDKRFDMVE
jgi:hypothetical protein